MKIIASKEAPVVSGWKTHLGKASNQPEEFTEQQIKTVCSFYLSVCLLYRNTTHSHVYTLNQKDLV